MYDLLGLLKGIVPKDPVILEAVACDGKDTVALKALWPLSTIYAFEPNPTSYRMLKERVSSHSDIFHFNMALGDKVGFSDFYLCRHPYLDEDCDTGDPSSILPPHPEKMPELLFEKIIQVPITTIDEWAEKNKIQSIDFMWLDMQGAEGLTLKASPKILRTVKALQVEYAKYSADYEGAVLLNEIHVFLRGNGFRLVLHSGDNYGDCIYAR